MNNIIEVTVKGKSGSGKLAIIIELAKVLRAHGLTCTVDMIDFDTIEDAMISEEVQARRLQFLSTSDRIVAIKEAQAPRVDADETNFPRL
jgi:Ni2+-binding GTPase involved in maturation of urease and hydrogenase